MKLSIPEEELMDPGVVSCHGCGATMAMRFVLKALGKETIAVIPACCWSIIAGPFPYSSLKIPLFHTAFETAGSVASGISAALQIKGKKATVLSWAGDGGTFDIGIQALSGAVERNENFIYICYDNEAYMNTGIQRSSATPWGAWTTTTPAHDFKKDPKKNMAEIMVAHKIPYTATASVAYPEDLVKKVKKAKEISGSKFIHILSPCPPGWRSAPEKSAKLARLAVKTRIFPLYEVEYGKYKVSMKSTPSPVTEYLREQGRFSHLTEEQVSRIQENVDFEWNMLLKKEEMSK
jgi:pyruvate/2-oxoacid:ferredoxin oxidoreductase beta subunit